MRTVRFRPPIRSCTQHGADTSFQVPRDPPHPSFGSQGPLDGSDPDRVAILQPPTAKTDPLLFCSREPSEHPALGSWPVRTRQRHPSSETLPDWTVWRYRALVDAG
jgi:hypothetical protein